MAEVKFYKVNTLPSVLDTNAWYIVTNGNYAEAYVTTNNGVVKEVGNSAMINDILSSYVFDSNSVKVVNTIADRNALSLTADTLVYVKDASADSTVGLGSATYIWSYYDSSWYKLVSGSVQSVTGLNTNNTDPKNPVVRVSVDNTTITGSGTPGSPLIAVGLKGDKGDVGPQGPTGIQGIQGPQGVSGSQGISGPIGATGPTGSKGLIGNIGPQGAAGESAYQVWLDNGGVGSQATFLLSLQGATGAQGIPGTTGPQGLKGDQGYTGPQGSQGPQGIIGLTGPQGLTGNTGLTGPQGPQGIQGVPGPSGGGGGSVNTVTGLNTDNTDPTNPIVKISVDPNRIGGTGIPSNMLVLTTTLLVSVKAGSSLAIAAGIAVGSSTYINSRLINNNAEVGRGGSDLPDFDMGTGESFFTKALSSDTITFSYPIEDEERIKIKII